MPQIDWEPLDFLEALGVVPVEEEFGTSFHYALTHPGIKLELTVWPLNADIALSLYCDAQSKPIVNLNLLGCPSARVINDKRGKFIEFAAANLFVGRFDQQSPAPYGFRLWLEPFVQVEPFAY